ncbi:MAG: DUF1264 domain-containing protein [Candidatus Eremiobacteraeota bacterium]|nr:DUF1264 domain-containing protein [Candidatus Eremiobacteraeota bacterium]
MLRKLFVPSLAVVFVIGFLAGRLHSALPAAAAGPTPTSGWTLHIDAEKHFGDSNPTEVAHHWCKTVAGGLIECQIYDSDAPDARLVEVETIVTPAVYNSFSPSEQALWHYHKVEIPKVNAKLPDMTPDQAAKTIAAITDTYGKVWMLWDPAMNANPVGTPTVVVLK